MKYLPFENFEIHTKLSSDEVFYRLRATVDTKETWWIFITKPFFGKVGRDRFKIRQTVLGNRRLLLVFGEIHTAESGSSVQIRIRMPWLINLFDIYVFGYIYLGFFIWIMNLILLKIQTGIWQVETVREWFLSLALYIVFFTIGCLLPLPFFKHEAYRVKVRLLQILGATKESAIYPDQVLGLTESQIIKAIFVIPIVISFGWMIYKLLL